MLLLPAGLSDLNVEFWFGSQRYLESCKRLKHLKRCRTVNWQPAESKPCAPGWEPRSAIPEVHSRWLRFEADREDAMSSNLNTIRDLAEREYKWGFVSDVESESVPKGLSEETVRLISAKKREPEFMLEWRLKAYRHWASLEKAQAEPKWANIHYGPIDYQDMVYYSAPKQKPTLESLESLDPELLRTYQKLGIPLQEQKMLAGVAVDAVFDSVSVVTTFKEKLREAGVIFCSFSEAVQKHPDLVRHYLGSVVPYTDNFFASLNAAVFSDGSFVYVPKGVRCPMELSTYFRINAAETGQFERTLIVADAGSFVSYLEGCTAPIRDQHQLHAAVVELVALDDAQIKYSTVQNWYPGDKEGRGGIYNFVTKRGKCDGVNSKISWTQVETGSAITWKYPSCILRGDNSVGEFYSVALTNNHQQADTGTKMIHIGKNTRSTIVTKGISAGHGQNTYRGQVKIMKGATGARNYTQCDSLLIGDKCGAHTFPYIEVRNSTARMEHEASTSKIGEDQMFYLRQRGITGEDAISMIVNGFCKRVFKELPMEFAVEAQKLLSVSLEGSVG
jgi:Fe-S cluster assembly protein SufB